MNNEEQFKDASVGGNTEQQSSNVEQYPGNESITTDDLIFAIGEKEVDLQRKQRAIKNLLVKMQDIYNQNKDLVKRLSLTDEKKKQEIEDNLLKKFEIEKEQLKEAFEEEKNQILNDFQNERYDKNEKFDVKKNELIENFEYQKDQLIHKAKKEKEELIEKAKTEKEELKEAFESEKKKILDDSNKTVSNLTRKLEKQRTTVNTLREELDKLQIENG